ncbi:MAG: GntR family transcriptional regulator [Nitrososphaerales archaeon]
MTTTPNIGAGVSRYIRLYSVLSQALVERRIGAGEPLPSEPQLMREYGVSRSTVRRALARLEAEGRIVRKRGSGTYARDGAQAVAPRSLAPLPHGAAGPPATTASRMLAFERVPTPGFLPNEQPGFGGTTLLIRQIRYIGRQPAVLETAYVPEEIGERLTRRRVGSEGGGILTILATLGHRSSSLEREFAALAADPLAANSLGLSVGAPVLNVRVLARNSQHRVLAYVNLCCRPDRYEARAAIVLRKQRRARAARRS